MDLPRRVVDVFCETSFGSGYLVGPQLVLTAGHVVRAGEHAIIRPLANGTPMRAARIWVGIDTDVALLKIIDNRWDPPDDLKPVRWGRLIGSSHVVPCTAIGFPRAQMGHDRARDTEQIRGEINLGTGLLTRKYQINVTSGAPTRQAEASPWSGMSGAAVTAEGLLLGVLTEDTPGFEGDRLTVEPAAAFLDEDGFNAAWLDETGIPPILDPVELAPLIARAPSPRAAESPASLLRADAEIVRFRGRAAELHRLLRWCDGNRFSVRLLIGPGGQGKTRLARELASRLGAQGWITGWLRDHVSAASYARMASNSEPVLLVIDYAETRIEQLKQVLLAASTHDGQALRILLIARSDGEWWSRFREELDRDIGPVLHDTAREALGPLDDEVSDRIAAFHEAVQDLAASLPNGRNASRSIKTPLDIHHPRYGSVLTLHLAALVTLLQSGETAIDAPAEVSAEEILLLHERRYWRSAALVYGVNVDVDIRDNAVTAATLCGARDRDEALALIAAIPGLSDQVNDLHRRAVKWLRDLYPASEDQFWGTIEPDRITEYLVANTLRAEPEYLRLLLVGASNEQVRRAFTILSRASGHQRSVVDHLTKILAELPNLAPIAAEIAVQSENPAAMVVALHAFANNEKLYLNDLIGLARAIPEQTQILADLAVDVWTNLTATYQKIAEVEPVKYLPIGADSLTNLANSLGKVGRHDQAIAAYSESLEIWRTLSQKGLANTANAESVAASLHGLAAHLVEVGRPIEALPMRRESVRMYRRLCGTDDRFRPDLAMVLNSLAINLGTLNHDEEAIDAAREAVEIYQSISEVDTANSHPRLVSALHTLAARLNEIGEHDEALDISVQAVHVVEFLTREYADAYLPLLARVLNLYAATLAGLSRYADACLAAQRAIYVYEELVAKNPAAYAPRLGRALSNIGVYYSEAGRMELALHSAERAVVIYQNLQSEILEQHQLGFARILNNLGNRLKDAGRQEEAVAVFRYAISVMIPLAATDPRMNSAMLAGTRVSLAYLLGNLRRFKEGELEASAAVQIFRTLADQLPRPYRPHLASALSALGFLRVLLGEYRAAICPIIEAIAIADECDAEDALKRAVEAIVYAFKLAPHDVRSAWEEATGQPLPGWLA